MHSQRQLYTIATFGKTSMGGKMIIHSGCFGCGKTYSLVEAFGLYCYELMEQGIIGLSFVLLGKTQQAVKKNMCNVLSNLFGENFKYDSSKKDGKIKDAVLFGQYIYIIGLNDASSESKFRGISDIMGILHDEAVLCTRDQFNYIIGRLRGQNDKRLPGHYIQHWYIGSTNPDTPNHFILDYVRSGVLKMVKWYMRDACWDGADEYYANLKKMYKDNPSFLSRYIEGKWTSTDRMVYKMFSYKENVINSQEVDIDAASMKRTFLGIDYGGDHPTAIVLGHVNHQDIYIISKVWKMQNTAPSDITARIANILDELYLKCIYVSGIYIDPSAKALKDEMNKVELKYTNALNGHNEGIGYIQTLFSMDNLFIMDTCEDLINEIYSYRYKDNNVGKDEVVKLDDDLVDAMRYGVYSDHMFNYGR